MTPALTNILLVAIGGSIGSVLRAVLNTYVVGLTGPAFPWGTILINILGSLVIGFFATLTATDGRFAAGAELRTFVMVGLCGGFTTFSSFSLQTLELIRDGRPAQALANILLSVVLCILSVSAGYALAMMLRTRAPAQLGDAGARGGVLVVVQDPDRAPAMLAVARQMVEGGAGPATALAVEGPSLARFMPTEEVMTEARATGRKRWTDSMKQVLDGWVAAERSNGYEARWLPVRDDGVTPLLEHGAGATLLVLELHKDDRTARHRLHAALARSRRPALLLPTATEAPIGRVIAVAWGKDDAAAGAVRSAHALLSKAERVVVLHLGDTPDEAGLWHALGDVPFTVRTGPAGNDPGQWLLRLAKEEGADLLVMGADSHGRLHERLFDDATEAVLRDATLPVLMAPVVV